MFNELLDVSLFVSEDEDNDVRSPRAACVCVSTAASRGLIHKHTSARFNLG